MTPLPRQVGPPIDWDEMDDAAKRSAVVEAMRWAAERSETPPGYAEALEHGADELARLDRLPSDGSPGWLKPAGRQGASLTADQWLARAAWAGEAERRARVEGRKLIDDVLPELSAELGVSVGALRSWMAEAKRSANPQIRLAYRAARLFGAQIFWPLSLD